MSIMDLLGGGLMGATPGINGPSPAQGGFFGGLMSDPSKMAQLQMAANILQASQGAPGQGRPGLGSILGAGAQGALQGAQMANQMQMQQAQMGLLQDKVRQTQENKKRYEEFVSSPDFQQLPPQVQQAIQAGGPDMLAQYHKGNMEQSLKGPETKVVGRQLLRIDPRTGQPEVLHTAPVDRAPSSFEQKISGLVQSGVPREQAMGIASGRYTVSVNPMTNERQVIDIFTGQPVGQWMPAPDMPDQPTGTALPLGIQPEAGTGLSGIASRAANVVSDALGQGLAFPKAEEARQAYQNLNVRTIGAMQEGIPGRPSNFLLEKLDSLTVKPNSLLQGDEAARVRLQQTRDMITQEIARIDRDILSTQGMYKPDVIQKTRQNRSQLQGLLADYEHILSSYGNANRPSLDEIFGGDE